MKIFVKTFGPVLLFFIVLVIGFNISLQPSLMAKFDQWAAESERSAATILAQSIANDLKDGRRAAVGATIGQVWANRPDWGLVEAYDASGISFYPPNPLPPLEGMRRVSVRISKGREHLGSLVIYFDGSVRLQAIRDAVAEFKILVIGLGAALLALSLVLHFSFVTRRIVKLRERFKDPVLTRSAHLVDRQANDEVGDLWRSFEEMRQQLLSRENLLAEARAYAEKESKTNLALRIKAEEVNKIKTEFITMLSHELRTPMNAIVGMASLVSKRNLESSLRQELGAIEQSAEQLMSLINQILDFSRIEAGAAALEHAPFDLIALIENLMRIANALPRPVAVALEAHIAPEVPRFLQGDYGRITQVLLNLVGNSIKFTERGRVDLKVVAELEAAGVWRLCFTVEDTGKGVPVSMQEKIFEPFAQVSRLAGGTGLGLPICRRYAMLMQGELTLESVEGQGSIFKFSVPLQAVVTAATAPLQSASPALGSTRMLRVLVAEDTPASALVMRLILERLGHTVRVAGDGQEAVQAFADECFDLVFLDIQMPVMDGLEAAREIRQLPRGNAVAIVALSALATDHDRKNAIASGFTDYLVKPIKAADVENLIARLDIQPRR